MTLQSRRRSITRKTSFAPTPHPSPPPSPTPNRPRRDSLFKRTTSVPATTLTTVIKSTTKGARSLASRTSNFTTIGTTSTHGPIPPNLEAHSPTTFLATLSHCSSTRGVLAPGGNDEYYFSSSTMMNSNIGLGGGGVGGGDDSYFSPMMESTVGGGSAMAVGVHMTSHEAQGHGQGPWSSMVLSGWIGTGVADEGDDDRGRRRLPSGLVTAIQVCAIVLLSASLVRNLRMLY